MKKKNTRGFTLVETLVAITILLVVIVGPMTIAQQGMQSAYYANEQTTAVFLAQEAIESVKKLRDDNALTYISSCTQPGGCSGNPWSWTGNLLASCTNMSGTGCDYDSSTQGYITCASDPSHCVIYQNNTGAGNVIYGHNTSWQMSGYTRTIHIDTSTSDAVSVTVSITWSAHLYGGQSRSVVLQTWLYNQYKQ